MAHEALQHLAGSEFANGLPYLNGYGVAPDYIRYNRNSSADPGVTNDSSQGYSVSSIWVNLAALPSPSVWVCASAALGAAVWGRIDNVQAGLINTLSETVITPNSWMAGNVLRRTASGYVLAQANSVLGIASLVGVVQSASASQYTVVYGGILTIPAHGFTIGSSLYLSPATAGALTSVAPQAPLYTVPVGVVLDVNRILLSIINPPPLSVPIYGIDTGTLNAYSSSVSPAPSAYYAGLEFFLIPNVTNTLGSTFNLNGLGTVPILRDSTNALLPGDIIAGKVIHIVHDGTRFQLINPANGTAITNDSFVAMIGQFASALSQLPSGWLLANGSAVSRTTYAKLFAAVGTTYGVGDGSTTFNLPELRGEFLRGLDNGRGVDAGRALGTLQGMDIQSHQHQIGNARGNFNSGGGIVAPDLANGSYPAAYSSATGGAETRPRNIALNFYIKF